MRVPTESSRSTRARVKLQPQYGLHGYTYRFVESFTATDSVELWQPRNED